MPCSYRATIALAIVAAALAVAGPATAHDQWLEPARRPFVIGQPASVSLHVGEAPTSDEEKTFERAKFTRLLVRSRNGPIDLLTGTKEGSKPVVSIDDLGKGEFLVVADRAPVLIELTPAKFDAYLGEEGLDHIKKERLRLGEENRPGRERYTRHMKGLIHVGDVVDHDLAQATIGQRLELFIETPAIARRGGAPLAARVLFDGRPLGGASVELSVRSAAGVRSQRSRTATDGRVSFVAAPSGFAIVHLVHMRRCVGRDRAPCKDADWESAWASFTLDIP